MGNHIISVGNGQGYDLWSNPQVLPEEEPVDIDETARDRAIDRAKMRSSYKHALGIVQLFAEEGESKKSIEARARKEWKRNRRMIQRGRVSYETTRGIPTAAVLSASFCRKPVQMVRSPQRRQSAASAASTHRTDDDSGGNDPDPEPDPKAARRAADVARIRVLTGEKFSDLEKRYWLRLLDGRWAV